jgi:hypothetical protein
MRGSQRGQLSTVDLEKKLGRENSRLAKQVRVTAIVFQRET